MDSLRFGLFALCVAPGLVTGCRSADKAGSSTGETRTDSESSAVRTVNAVQWFRGSAPLLLVPGRTPDRAMIALADTMETEPEGLMRDSNATFLSLDGTRTNGRVAITQSAEGCIEAAIAPTIAVPWGVGFIGGSPSPLRVDSIRGMSRQDSSALTRTSYRLASTVPNGAGSRFAGLPFAIVDLWRVHLPDGRTAIATSLRRQINQEDSPLQERTFIIAESDSLASDGYSLMHSERSSGPEETVDSRELLAAVTFPPSTTVEFIIVHDFGDETSYSIVERVATAKWIVKWASQRFSC